MFALQNCPKTNKTSVPCRREAILTVTLVGWRDLYTQNFQFPPIHYFPVLCEIKDIRRCVVKVFAKLLSRVSG